MSTENKQGGVGGFFKNIAPYLSTVASLAVPGPAGALAASIINKVTGQDVKPDSVAEAIQNMSLTEEGRLKLDSAEKEFSLACKKMGFDHEDKLFELEVKDRDSARRRQIELKDRFVPVLACVIIGAFITAVMALIRGWGKVETAFAGTLIGYLAANANQVVSFYFGSSAGSARKTDLLAKADAVKE